MFCWKSRSFDSPGDDGDDVVEIVHHVDAGEGLRRSCLRAGGTAAQ